MTYNCSIDLKKSIDWQRGSAEKVIKLIDLKQKWYEDNHCSFWNNWVVDVFDLRTANEFGLSVWSIILDVPIFGEQRKSRPDYPALYFGQFRSNFYQSNFAKNASEIERLSIEQKRIILQLKAFILNTNSSTYEINKKLADLFGFQQVFAIDNFDMSYTYIINDPTLSDFIEVVEDLDLLPRPNCVSVDVIIN